MAENDCKPARDREYAAQKQQRCIMQHGNNRIDGGLSVRSHGQRHNDAIKADQAAQETGFGGHAFSPPGWIFRLRAGSIASRLTVPDSTPA
jgi:hypothetical protein